MNHQHHLKIETPETVRFQKLLRWKRVARIELATKAWEAFVLPLNYTRRLYQ